MQCRTRKQKNDFAMSSSEVSDRYYDLFEDWALIDASFTQQYGIRLRKEDDMSWDEFCTLLNGLGPKTTLGQIVSIRSENDKNILKHFTKEQHRIRNEWRRRRKSVQKISKAQYDHDMKMFEKMFASLAKIGGDAQ